MTILQFLQDKYIGKYIEFLVYDAKTSTGEVITEKSVHQNLSYTHDYKDANTHDWEERGTALVKKYFIKDKVVQVEYKQKHFRLHTLNRHELGLDIDGEHKTFYPIDVEESVKRPIEIKSQYDFDELLSLADKLKNKKISIKNKLNKAKNNLTKSISRSEEWIKSNKEHSLLNYVKELHFNDIENLKIVNQSLVKLEKYKF